MNDSKRKASAHEEEDERATKKRKLPKIDLSKGETPETTTEYGLAFLETVKHTRDKHGRLIATDFLSLPERDSFPDYYETIVMPIALDTVEAKLHRREFPTLTTLESYMKRMVANAKAYNENGSEIFCDAERIRKVLCAFMKSNNPAYRNPSYSAFPTPLPTEDEVKDDEADADGEDDPDAIAVEHEEEAEPSPMRPKRSVTSSATKANGRSRRSASLITAGTVDELESFAGKTLFQAQEIVLSELINLKDEEGQDISYPFVNLPSRKLVDYYHTINRPISLKGVEKKVRGIHGRNAPTGVSDFKTWKAFEDEVSYVWRNAREYNVEGSEIYNMAGQVEDHFGRRVAEAKKYIPEMIGESGNPQRLKLKMSGAKDEPPQQKIMLRMGGTRKDSPNVTPRPNSASPAIHVNGSSAAINDDSSRPRRGENVRTSSMSNGISGSRNPFSGGHTGANSITLLSQTSKDRTGSFSGSAASPSPSASAVKAEDRSVQSPSAALGIDSPSRAHTNGVPPAIHAPGMPPPSHATQKLNTESPFLAQATPVAATVPLQAPQHPLVHTFESKWRLPGRDASDALITNLGLKTHPGLNVANHFSMNISPHPTLSQQSTAFHLPATHYYLQIIPTISMTVINSRQYKIFGTANGQRLNAMPLQPGQNTDQRRPLFEARLIPGVNRIEVEVIAGPPRGAPKTSPGQDVELERITVLANLLKA